MRSLKYQKHLFKNLNRECKYIIFSIFLVAFSTFIFNPYIPIYLYKNFNFLPSQIGLIVFLQFFIQQSGGFFAGFLSDKYGHYILFRIGVCFRVVSLLGIIFSAQNVGLMIGSLFLFSAAGAVLTLGQRSLLISKAKSSREKAYAVSLNNSLMNSGQGLGVLIGGFIYSVHYSISFFVALFVYFLIILIVVFAIKKDNKSKTKPLNLMESISNRDGLLKNRFFVLVIISQFFYVAVWSKIGTYMSLFIEHKYNNIIAYSIIMSISLAFISLSQMFLGTLVAKQSFKKVVCLGYSMVALGFLLICMVDNLFAVAFFMVIVSVGISLVALQNELQIINSKNIGAVYGVFRFFTGFGVLSVYVGGYIYQWLQSIGLVDYFWLYMSFLSLVICAIVAISYPRLKEAEKLFKDQRT